MTAVQGFSKLEDVSSATGIMCANLSGAYFVAIAQSLFANRMLQTILSSAAHLDATLVLEVIAAYMVGIKDGFAFSLACAAFAVLLSLIIPFKRLPDHGKKDKPATQEAAEEQNKKAEGTVDGDKENKS
ncbi:Major facilitator superfamily domain general substrate transporter [Penicillium cf. viridicatum]|uniref:Major facilitator superfamily domain general substrate transporter n=1 Tax=Penicillium cf. viridicatum TaxID=2972119 RepID=A0A9W9M206_9EURO|nr:Major facilitator superfamily domain general substrate transporter [Penicillium cf. viridicatum]